MLRPPAARVPERHGRRSSRAPIPRLPSLSARRNRRIHPPPPRPRFLPLSARPGIAACRNQPAHRLHRPKPLHPRISPHHRPNAAHLPFAAPSRLLTHQLTLSLALAALPCPRHMGYTSPRAIDKPIPWINASLPLTPPSPTCAMA